VKKGLDKLSAKGRQLDKLNFAKFFTNSGTPKLLPIPIIWNHIP